MNLRVFLGVALLLDVAALGIAVITGVDTGPLDELAYALAGGTAGATLPRTATA